MLASFTLAQARSQGVDTRVRIAAVDPNTNAVWSTRALSPPIVAMAEVTIASSAK